MNDYLDSITESLGSTNLSRHRRLLAALSFESGPLPFAELARRLPDPPKQIARDVFDLAERHLVSIEPSGPDTTRVEITDEGRKVLNPG